MSAKQQTLLIYPEESDKDNFPEVKSFSEFECPTCKGRGFFNNGGWSTKFKKEPTDPDYVECTRCKGTGELQTKIIMKWEAADKPSKCPTDDGSE